MLGKEINKKQHSQRYFETLLHHSITKLDSNYPVYLESESSKIGNLHIPNKLWEKLNLSERILLKVPTKERVKFLFEVKGIQCSCNEFGIPVLFSVAINFYLPGSL